MMIDQIHFHFTVSQVKASISTLGFCIDMGGFSLLIKLDRDIFKPFYFKFTETKP